MTAAPLDAHRTLPRTADIKHPRRMMLHGLRPVFAAGINRRWDVEVRGVENHPTAGPVVVAANHIGFLDGPLMAIFGPRPVHALTKREMFSGSLGAFLSGAGQIPVDRDAADPQAIKAVLRVLRDGGVAGLFPESTRGGGLVESARGGAAYLALATGATVVPLAFLGTRVLGGSTNSLPPSGSRFVLSYGSPITVEEQGWPRRSADVRTLTEQIRLAIIATTDEARRATGMELPGPIPDTDGTSPLPGPASDSSKAEHD